MFLRKYWFPLLVFLVVIVGISLYYLQARPAKDPIMIYKPTKPIEKPTQPPTAEVRVGDTSAHVSEPTPSVSEGVIKAEIPTENKPLADITFEEYKQRFVEWENLPRDEWGIALRPDGKGVALFPKPPGQAGKWQTREEKEKASDLWWAEYKKKVAASRKTFQLLRERDRRLGGR